MFAFLGKKGNCEFNFCVCTWLYVVCKWLTHLLHSFKCDCGKNSQFVLIRLSHLKKRPTVYNHYVIFPHETESYFVEVYSHNVGSICKQIRRFMKNDNTCLSSLLALIFLAHSNFSLSAAIFPCPLQFSLPASIFLPVPIFPACFNFLCLLQFFLPAAIFPCPLQFSLPI